VKLHLLEFLRHESDQRLQPMLVAMLMSGVGNGALIALANLGATSAEFTAVRGLLLALYIAALMLYIAGLRRALASGFVASEQALERVRTRLTTGLLQADLAYVERHAETGRFTPLTQDTRLIADAMTQAETAIVGELNGCPGRPVDIGGYYHPDAGKCAAEMRPSPTLNAIVDPLR
jgi:ABC-type siderophore export system fused ATPase/permease subunit